MARDRPLCSKALRVIIGEPEGDSSSADQLRKRSSTVLHSSASCINRESLVGPFRRLPDWQPYRVRPHSYLKLAGISDGGRDRLACESCRDEVRADCLTPPRLVAIARWSG
jgi:hypothetical protein